MSFFKKISDFIKYDVHKWYPDLDKHVKITLIEASPKILGSFKPSLSDYTMKLFSKRKIELLTKHTVKEVRQHEILLDDETLFPYGLCVWSTGIAPTNLIKSLPFEKESGRIKVDPYLRVINYEDIYAIGDCAAGYQFFF